MDYSKIRSIDDLGDIRGKRVLLRADFNVPLDGSRITSDRRIQAALPTIDWLIDKGARLVLCSHLGRPKGDGPEAEFTLAPVAARLGDLLGFKIPLLPDCVGEGVRAEVEALGDGRAAMLENLRFHKAEKKGDEAFGRELAALADIYVNEAFGTCHRGDASMTWPAKLLPHAAGMLVKREVDALSSVLTDPARPCVAVLGGAKVSDKIPLVNNLLPHVQEICLGGGMAYTFLKAQGAKIGKSLCEDERLEEAAAALQKARELDVVVHLPSDHVCSTSIDEESAHQVGDDIPDGEAAFDIGEKTARAFCDAILRAKTILLNGPMGVFEKSRYGNGTRAVVSAIADATSAGAFSVVGGGDSAAAVDACDCADKMSHVSTGGGASLTLLQGGSMPALDALGG